MLSASALSRRKNEASTARWKRTVSPRVSCVPEAVAALLIATTETPREVVRAARARARFPDRSTDTAVGSVVLL